jgi:hypothetical protein
LTEEEQMDETKVEETDLDVYHFDIEYPDDNTGSELDGSQSGIFSAHPDEPWYSKFVPVAPNKEVDSWLYLEKTQNELLHLSAEGDALLRSKPHVVELFAAMSLHHLIFVLDDEDDYLVQTGRLDSQVNFLLSHSGLSTTGARGSGHVYVESSDLLQIAKALSFIREKVKKK